MADSTLVEGVKLLGGIAGLGTTAFTIWDRLFRERPQVWVVATPIYQAGQRYLYLVVRNPAPVQIRVTSISVAPDLFQVWRDNSAEAAADAQMGVKPTAFIDAEAERRFPILIPSSGLEENEELLCKVTVRWRSMRHEQIPCIPVFHRKTVQNDEGAREQQGVDDGLGAPAEFVVNGSHQRPRPPLAAIGRRGSSWGRDADAGPGLAHVARSRCRAALARRRATGG